jgi:hypothetical protein
MRKAAVAVVCLALMTCLGGCDFLNYIWQRIVGISYSGIDLASVQNAQGSMSSTNIAGSRIPGSSVMAYRTRNGLLGKIGVLSSGTDLSIQLTTWDSVTGAVVAQATNLIIHANAFCDLETGTEVVGLGSASDFEWKGDQTLVPQGTAVFYIYP